ncbi:hypothetical protein ACFFX0_24390 [Citricoccus parietis]|uniref:Uncharacterized protein n=1 Tax=Citricoccus parietis TaxID=592307 RepID=A0ABV5G5D5_9MICC
MWGGQIGIGDEPFGVIPAHGESGTGQRGQPAGVGTVFGHHRDIRPKASGIRAVSGAGDHGQVVPSGQPPVSRPTRPAGVAVDAREAVSGESVAQ